MSDSKADKREGFLFHVKH